MTEMQKISFQIDKGKGQFLVEQFQLNETTLTENSDLPRMGFKVFASTPHFTSKTVNPLN